MRGALFALASIDPAAATTAGVPLVEVLVEKGSLGLIILILLGVIRYQEMQKSAKDDAASATRVAHDAALKSERDARLEDQKALSERVLSVSERVHEAVDDITKVIDHIERRKS